MKTKVEIGEYEITIEEIDGMISVKAEKDEEVIEEFSIEVESGDTGDDDGDVESGNQIKGFADFGGEEEDFDGDDLEDSDDDDLEDSDDDDDDDLEDSDDDEDDLEGGNDLENIDKEKTLESFQSFINRRK